MKYIIEIEEEPFGRNDDPVIPHGMDELYRAKGFNALVFDKHGLDKLTPLNDALDEAFHAARVNVGECEDRVAKQAYQQGFEDGRNVGVKDGMCEAWEAARKIVTWPDRSLVNSDTFDLDPGENIFTKYSASRAIALLREYEEQQKQEIKVWDVITDGKINYLVIDITDNSYIALRGTDFEPTYIGKDYIGLYYNLHDSKDMRKIAEEINKAMKGKQRTCSTCKYSDGSDVPKCSDCCLSKGYSEWELKEGAE